MPISSKPCIHLPAGHRLLSVIETKFLHLLNIMKLAPYSADYVSLRHPEMCSCSNTICNLFNTYLSQRGFFCFLHVGMCSGYQAETEFRLLCSMFTYIFREHSHGGYWQVHSPPSQVPSNGARRVQTAQGALGWGEGMGCRMLKDLYMGRGGAGCSGGLPWEEWGYRMIRESSMGRGGCRMLKAFQRGRGCRMFRKDNLPGQGCRLRVVSWVSKL